MYGAGLYCTIACQPGVCGTTTSEPCLQAETEELKKQIEDLSTRLTALSADNSSLQNRNSLLEKVVQIRGNGDASVSAEVLLPAASLFHFMPVTMCILMHVQSAGTCACMLVISRPGDSVLLHVPPACNSPDMLF